MQLEFCGGGVNVPPLLRLPRITVKTDFLKVHHESGKVKKFQLINTWVQLLLHAARVHKKNF